MSPAQIIKLPDPDQITEATLLAAFKEYAHAVLELAERSNDRDMRMLAQLEKLETGQQNVVKELKALSLKVDTGLNALNGEVRGLHGEVKALSLSVDTRLNALSLKMDTGLNALSLKMETNLNEQTELLKIIADNTKPR